MRTGSQVTWHGRQRDSCRSPDLARLCEFPFHSIFRTRWSPLLITEVQAQVGALWNWADSLASKATSIAARSWAMQERRPIGFTKEPSLTWSRNEDRDPSGIEWECSVWSPLKVKPIQSELCWLCGVVFALVCVRVSPLTPLSPSDSDATASLRLYVPPE